MLKKFATRFEELEEQVNALAKTKTRTPSHYGEDYDEVDRSLLLGWCVKSKNLLAIACGTDSQHFQSFVTTEVPTLHQSSFELLERARAVFLAAKEDYEGGYITSVKTLVQAAVFDDELEQAQELFASGYITAAAVIAGTVLETAVRSLCDQHSQLHGKLDKMNADLAKAGVYNVLKQKQVTAHAATRNSAAHGKTDEFNKGDVEDLINGTARFITDYLN